VPHHILKSPQLFIQTVIPNPNGENTPLEEDCVTTYSKKGDKAISAALLIYWRYGPMMDVSNSIPISNDNPVPKFLLKCGPFNFFFPFCFDMHRTVPPLNDCVYNQTPDIPYPSVNGPRYGRLCGFGGGPNLWIIIMGLYGL
jgi:hypothetical protein